MSNKSIFPGLVFAIFCCVSLPLGCQAETWRGITPLVSRRTDVERALGKPGPGSTRSTLIYVLDAGDVTIRLSDGRSIDPVLCQSRAPAGTVLEIVIKPKVKQTFSLIQPDRSRFSVIPLSGDTGTYIYRDIEGGLTYAVSSDDELKSIQYGPSKKDWEKVGSRH